MVARGVFMVARRVAMVARGVATVARGVAKVARRVAKVARGVAIGYAANGNTVHPSRPAGARSGSASRGPSGAR